MGTLLEKSLQEQIEKMLINEMTRDGAAGLSISIVQDNKVVYATGFGPRNLEAQLPADEHTLYGLASVTKSFTALSILKLYEAHKLDLHDPITKYVS